MAIVESLIVFIVSLIIGAIGIYIGASVLTDYEDYTYALVTALIGAIVWVVFSWIPLLGPLLALIAYILVIHFRYPGGILRAIGIALVAWLAALVVLYVLAVLGITTFDAVGVPGV